MTKLYGNLGAAAFAKVDSSDELWGLRTVLESCGDLELDDTEVPGGLPIGGQAKVELPNNHLEYAITWYSLALTLIVMFVLYHRRPTSDDEKDAQA